MTTRHYGAEATNALLPGKASKLSLTLEEVIAFFSRKRVAKYKYPERIVIVEKLPRTASGKVQKFLLRQDIIERLRQEHTAV